MNKYKIDEKELWNRVEKMSLEELKKNAFKCIRKLEQDRLRKQRQINRQKERLKNE